MVILEKIAFYNNSRLFFTLGKKTTLPGKLSLPDFNSFYKFESLS